MFANPAKRSKPSYTRPHEEAMDQGPPANPEEGMPPKPPQPPQGEVTPPPLKANKTGNVVITALDEVYKEDSDGPGFIACQFQPGAQDGLESYDSAEKGGIFAAMDAEGSINAQFPSINMDSASTQLLFTPDVVVTAQQNSMAAIGMVQVGDIRKRMMVIAVKVTADTRQYLINNFLNQTMNQRFYIVGQVMEEVFKGRSLFSVILYKGILNQTDFTPSNLSILELQVGNVQEKIWNGKKITNQWVKNGYATQHKEIQQATGKEKFLLELHEDKLILKANNLAIATNFTGGKTQDLPGEYPLKCQNFAGVGQVPIQKATLHPGATIYQNPTMDKSLLEGQSPTL